MSGLRADKMPIGMACGPCVAEQHRFIHPRALIGNLWQEDDGCPCCYSHVDDEQHRLFPRVPPMGYGEAAHIPAASPGEGE